MKNLPQNPDEIVLVGSRPAAKRKFMAYLGLATMGIVAAAGTLHQDGINPASLSQYQGETQQATAQVVGKIWYAGGVALTDKGGQANAWQPLAEVSSSKYSLLLSIPGMLDPVDMAVSKEVYDSYCKHVDAKDYKSRNRTSLRSAQFAPCGTQYGLSGAPVVKVDRLDTVNLTFTRGHRDNSIQVQTFEGTSKQAISLLERLALRQDTKAPEVNFTHTPPKG